MDTVCALFSDFNKLIGDNGASYKKNAYLIGP